MACPVLITPTCVAAGKAAGAAAGTAASGALNGIAAAIESGITWMVTQTATWWGQGPPPGLAGGPAHRDARRVGVRDHLEGDPDGCLVGAGAAPRPGRRPGRGPAPAVDAAAG